MRVPHPISGPCARMCTSLAAAVAEWTPWVPTFRSDALFEAADVDPTDDPTVVEPLQAMIDSARGELGLGARGRVLLGHRFVGLLRTRRFMRSRRDLIGASTTGPTASPMLVVTGFPRTGTTLMHRLLATAPDAISPRWFEVMEPCLDPARPVEAARRERLERWRRALRGIDLLSPNLRRVHEILVDGPEECTHLHEAAFDSESFALAGPCAHYRSWLDDRTPERRRERYHWQARCLEAILADRPDDERAGRWVLKAPQHLLQIDDLLAVFPHARVVRMHRDPVATMTSTASLVRHSSTIVGGHVGADRSEELIEIFEEWQRRGDESTAAHPEAVLEIHYDDLLADPLGVVDRIQRFAGLPLSDVHADRVARHLDARPRHHFGRHRYRPEDFGIDVGATRERLEAYETRIAGLRASTPAAAGLG